MEIGKYSVTTGFVSLFQGAHTSKKKKVMSVILAHPTGHIEKKKIVFVTHNEFNYFNAIVILLLIHKKGTRPQKGIGIKVNPYTIHIVFCFINFAQFNPRSLAAVCAFSVMPARLEKSCFCVLVSLDFE